MSLRIVVLNKILISFATSHPQRYTFLMFPPHMYSSGALELPIDNVRKVRDDNVPLHQDQCHTILEMDHADFRIGYQSPVR